MWIKREKAANGLTEVTLVYCNKQEAMHCFLNGNGRIRGKAEVYDFDGDIKWSFELNDNEDITGTFVEPGYGQDMDTHTSVWKDGVCIDPGDDEYLEVGSTIDDLEWLLDGDTEPFVEDYVVQMEEGNCDEDEDTDENDPDLEGFEEFDGNML